MFVANGELPSAAWGSTEDDARVIAGADRWSDAGYQLHAGDSENDHTFSWSQCDHCHSGAGGSRHHAVAMRADTDSVHCDSCGAVCDATDSWTDGTIALCGSVYGNGCADRKHEQTLRDFVGAPAGAPLPSYAWPGGYPIMYLLDDGGTLCGDCANDPTNPTHFPDPNGKAGDGWGIVGAYVADGDDAETCDHCGKVTT